MKAKQLGPILVALGASLWGTETIWRVKLNRQFLSDVMVLYEHVLLVILSLPILWVFRRQLTQISKRTWLYLLASGILGSALGAYFFTMALRSMNASVANVFLQVQPLLSVLIAHCLLKEKLAPGFWKWAGLALFSGLLLSLEGLSSWEGGINLSAVTQIQANLSPALLFIALTAACWSFSTVAGRAINTSVSYQVASPLRFVIGLVAMGFMVLLNGHWGQWSLLNLQKPTVLFDLLTLSVVAGFIPLFIYFKGLSLTPASVASFWEMFQIVAALLVTWGVMNQALAPHQVLATVLLLIAVQQINRVQASVSTTLFV